MEHPKAYFESQRDRNLHALTAHIDEPLVIIDMESGHTLVQYGELKSHTDKHMILQGSVHAPNGAVVLDIPEQGTVIAGKIEVRLYTEQLLARFDDTKDHQLAVVAATVIDRFSTDTEQPDSDQLCTEIAKSIIESEPENSMVAACVLDAPETLLSTIMAELQRRLALHKTLYEVQRDRLLMLFVSHISEAEGVSELEALQRIAQANVASPLA